MADRLLRKADIAAMLATNADMAASILKKYGCYPIDFGCGRNRGLRWLESAAVNAIRLMHMQAQPAPVIKTKKFKAPQGELNLASKSVKEMEGLLTPEERVQ